MNSEDFSQHLQRFEILDWIPSNPNPIVLWLMLGPQAFKITIDKATLPLMFQTADYVRNIVYSFIRTRLHKTLY